MAVVNIDSNIALDGFSVVDTAAKEIIYICIIDLPTHITIYLFQ